MFAKNGFKILIIALLLVGIVVISLITFAENPKLKLNEEQLNQLKEKASNMQILMDEKSISNYLKVQDKINKKIDDGGLPFLENKNKNTEDINPEKTKETVDADTLNEETQSNAEEIQDITNLTDDENVFSEDRIIRKELRYDGDTVSDDEIPGDTINMAEAFNSDADSNDEDENVLPFLNEEDIPFLTDETPQIKQKGTSAKDEEVDFGSRIIPNDIAAGSGNEAVEEKVKNDFYNLASDDKEFRMVYPTSNEEKKFYEKNNEDDIALNYDAKDDKFVDEDTIIIDRSNPNAFLLDSSSLREEKEIASVESRKPDGINVQKIDVVNLKSENDELNKLLTVSDNHPFLKSPDSIFPKNKQLVDVFIKYYNGLSKKDLAKALRRFEFYFPLVKEVLTAQNVPLELAVASIALSNFDLFLTNQSKSGIWQLDMSLAKPYGLYVNNSVDERIDPVKGTKVFAKQIKRLYDTYNDWDLALAAYVSNSGYISAQMRKFNNYDFWSLATESGFDQNAVEVVSKFHAILTILTNNREYGFSDINYTKNLNYENVRFNGYIKLEEVSRKANMNYDLLRLLNPQLVNFVIPDNYDGLVRIPSNRKEQLIEAMMRDRRQQNEQFVAKRNVQEIDENINKIAENSGNAPGITNLEMLENKIATNLKLSEADFAENHQKRSNSSGTTIYEAENVKTEISYKMKYGDTLYSLARKHNIDPQFLQSYNNIQDATKISIGKVIKIPNLKANNINISMEESLFNNTRNMLKSENTNSNNQPVQVVEKATNTKKTDKSKVNESDIPEYNISGLSNLEDILLIDDTGNSDISLSNLTEVALNNNDGNSNDLDMDSIIGNNTESVYTVKEDKPKTKQQTKFVDYVVKKGESIWRICNRYNISVMSLVKANNITDPSKIFEGQKLKIPAKSK